MPQGLYALARQKTVHLLDDFLRRGITAPDFDDPALVTGWFADYYADVRQGQDAFDVQKARAAFRYGTVAQSVRLIRDDTVAVLPLQYDPEAAEAILEAAEEFGRMTSGLWRRLQPLLVNVYTKDVQRLNLEERHPGLFLWPGRYDPRVGLAAVLQDSGSGTVYEPADLMG